MYVSAYMYVDILHVCSACGGQKTVLEILEPEFQSVLSLHVLNPGLWQEQEVALTIEPPS